MLRNLLTILARRIEPSENGAAHSGERGPDETSIGKGGATPDSLPIALHAIAFFPYAILISNPNDYTKV